MLSICYHFSFAAHEHACNLKAFSLRRDERRELYIPLVPPEARAVFHFALASFMKTSAKLCSSLRSFWPPFSAGKGVLSGKATPPLCPPRGTKGITH